MTIPAGWGALGFTSGRRTYRGNKLVGGVSNSDHLHGTAADFTAPLSVLRARFPNNPILDEGDHRHVSGLSDVPYYGNKGIAGLVNGVDTTAPKGTPMLQPRKPRPKMAGLETPLTQAPLGFMGAQPDMPQMGPLADAPQVQGKPPSKFNAGAILGILGDALRGYAGQAPIFAPMMMQQQEMAADDERFDRRLAATERLHTMDAIRKAQEPPAEVQTAMYWDRLRQDNPALFGALMSTMDSVKPNYEQVTDDQGYVREVQKNRVQTQEIDGKTYYNVNGKWFAAGGQ